MESTRIRKITLTFCARLVYYRAHLSKEFLSVRWNDGVWPPHDFLIPTHCVLLIPFFLPSFSSPVCFPSPRLMEVFFKSYQKITVGRAPIPKVSLLLPLSHPHLAIGKANRLGLTFESSMPKSALLNYKRSP